MLPFAQKTVFVALIATIVFTTYSAVAQGKPRRYSYRAVAMNVRKSPPPMLITYFRSPTSGDTGAASASKSSPERSAFYLGVGFLGTVVRDSAAIVGAPRIAYGGISLSALWQPQTAWLVRFGLGYASRTFSIAQDPTGGFGQVGQYWSGNLALEYEWLHIDSFRVSTGWSHWVSYGYRSRDFLNSPTFGRVGTLKPASAL